MPIYNVTLNNSNFLYIYRLYELILQIDNVFFILLIFFYNLFINYSLIYLSKFKLYNKKNSMSSQNNCIYKISNYRLSNYRVLNYHS